MNGSTALLEYAVAAMDTVHTGESDDVRTWAAALMTDAVAGYRATVPLRYRDAHLGALDDDQSPGRIRAWLRHPESQTLFVVGESGTGKTFSAWATVAETVVEAVVAASLGRVVTAPVVGVRPVPDLLDDLRSEGRLPSAWGTLRTAPLLCLDDLGAARPTPWALERMWSLVNARSDNGVRTVVTTNSDWNDLVSTWGEPIMERLRDRSVTVEMLGASRRRLIAI